MELTFKIPKELEEEVRKVSEAELTSVVLQLLKLELMRRTRLLQARERFERIVSKSKLTEAGAKALADKVNWSLARRYEKLLKGAG